jgi:hypothetical protein
MIKDVLTKFQQTHPDIYIGGSVSLILQGIIPYREPKDIDIISTKRIHIYELFGVDKLQHRLIKKYRYENLLFDLFINPQAKYIEYIYNGHVLKLSPADEIYQWKLREKNISKEKHIEDLKYYDRI